MHCFFNSAYLYAGTAARVAFTLGMHADKYSITHGLVQKEQARRIWWSLYVFDEEMSLRCGKPGSIPEGHLGHAPPLPSEQVSFTQLSQLLFSLVPFLLIYENNIDTQSRSQYTQRLSKSVGITRQVDQESSRGIIRRQQV